MEEISKSTQFARKKCNRSLKIMKISILLFFFCIMTIDAENVYSQQKEISLDLRNVTIQKAIHEIEQKSDYLFLITDEAKQELNKRTSVRANKESIFHILESVLEGTSLRYNVVERQVSLYRSEEVASPEKHELVTVEMQQQKRTITGRITDKNGETVIGANIIEEGTRNGTVTDLDGNFSLVVGENAIIHVSYIGYLSQIIHTSGRALFDIILQEDTQKLDELVVVGYGTTKKVNLTGALTILEMDKFANSTITNATQALSGASGLWVNQAGSKPGQDVGSIRIRGIGTLSDNNPLVIVDGIEYPLSEINPNFIESITVLKDASAAIYGSRGGNGVILVTTKAGKKRDKAIIDYSFTHGISQATFLPDVVWDPIRYMQMKNQAMINEGKLPASVDYSEAQIEEYQQGMATNPYAYPNVNWFDIIFKNGYIQQHNLRVSGGTDKVLFNIGIGYMDQEGILIDANHANRYTLNVNVSANASERLKIGANIVGNYRTYTEPGYGGSDAEAWFFNRFFRVLPIFTPYTADGKYGNSVFQTPGRNSPENPLLMLKEGYSKQFHLRSLTKLFAEYQLPFNISYNVNLGVDKLDSRRDNLIAKAETYHPLTGIPTNANSYTRNYNYDNNELNLSFYQTATWNPDFHEDHDLSLMVGSSYNDFNQAYFSAQVEGYFDNSLTDLSAGSENYYANGKSQVKDVLISYFNRINYSYKDKYLLEGVVRYDGSSRFRKGKRWGSFPSASAAWRIDQEGFMESLEFIDLLKARVSWGKIGTQAVALHSYLNTVNMGSGYNYPFGGIPNTGAATTAYNYPNISWETTTNYNAGFDVTFLNNKIAMNLDLFKKHTSGILRGIDIPEHVGGLSGPKRNIGEVQNKGYELNVTYRNTIREFRYEVSGGITHVKNKVVKLETDHYLSGRKITKVGYPIDSWYLLEADGIFQNQAEVNIGIPVTNAVKPGYIRFKDQDNNGIIDGDDRVIAGSSIPRYTYNFSINLGYKSLSLTSYFQGVYGIDHYPALNLSFPFFNGAGVTKEWVSDSWTPETPDAPLPILTTATGAPEMYSDANSSTFWLKDGSYVRLKMLQLKYELPHHWVYRLGLNKLSLFVNGENLLTFTKFTLFDPEKRISSSSSADNIYGYPTLKTYSFGLNVLF